MKDKIFKSILYFFIAMFCCTLISRTSASVTVAKVATEHLKSGSLTCRFQGNGKIMAADRTFQSLPEGQKIARILVKEGNAVKKGEAVVLLDLPYLLERITEKEREIQKVQLTLEQLELEGKENARVAATIPAESALRKAIRHLEEVQSAYEEEKATVEEVTATEKACEQAWEVYDLAELEEEAFAENEAARKEALELSKKSTQLELEKLQEELQKLRKIENEEGIVAAQEDGVLEAVEASVGTITSGTEQIILQTGGLEACGIVPAEQIGTLETGDEIQIQVQGDSQRFPVQIERFETDKDGNMLWFGKIEEKTYRTGTPFSHEYTEKSDAFYENLIPLGALHESMGETYVLTAEIRSGILGEGYTAVKVPVTVLEKDDTNAAVRTNLPGDALIITQSNKYVKEGDRVRLNE